MRFLAIVASALVATVCCSPVPVHEHAVSTDAEKTMANNASLGNVRRQLALVDFATRKLAHSLDMTPDDVRVHERVYRERVDTFAMRIDLRDAMLCTVLRSRTR